MGSVLDRTLIQSADGVKGGAARLVLRSAILGSALPVLEENGRSRLPSITEALRCIPEKCRQLVSLVIEHSSARRSGTTYVRDDEEQLSKDGLISAKAVLLTLVPEFSAECTLPLSLVPTVLELTEHGPLPYNFDTARARLHDCAPEVYELIKEIRDGSVATVVLVKKFLRGLCALISSQMLSTIAPPPWEPIPKTYNPPARGKALEVLFLFLTLTSAFETLALKGIALYFTGTGLQGRYTPRFEVETDTRRGSNPCSHKFVGRRKKTGGIFNWFCPHGFGYGTSIITNAEGRKDAMLSLYTHCESAPKVVVYDFVCQLEEDCRNRVPAFFAETRYTNTRASLIFFLCVCACFCHFPGFLLIVFILTIIDMMLADQRLTCCDVGRPVIKWDLSVSILRFVNSGIRL